MIGHTEENLKPFYSHLKATHDRLRKEDQVAKARIMGAGRKALAAAEED